MVDLAGSENANKAGNAGERLEEMKYINKSLSTLVSPLFLRLDPSDQGFDGRIKAHSLQRF
jgi:Kinesin motor domain